MPPARFASTLVLLVRHGVTPTTGRLLPGRRRGLHLSEEGRRQAEALAVRLAAVPKLAAIYSSPLERAREPVAPLAKARGLAVPASLGLGWDEKRQRIVVVAESVVDEEGEEPATARFAITRAQAAAFVERTESLVKAGRPICPMCSQPRDPAGHVCPRSNGHVVTA